MNGVIHRRSCSSARSTFPDARCISVSVSRLVKRENNAVESLKAFEQEYSLFTRSIPANIELPVYSGIKYRLLPCSFSSLSSNTSFRRNPAIKGIKFVLRFLLLSINKDRSMCTHPTFKPSPNQVDPLLPWSWKKNSIVRHIWSEIGILESPERESAWMFFATLHRIPLASSNPFSHIIQSENKKRSQRCIREPTCMCGSSSTSSQQSPCSWQSLNRYSPEHEVCETTMAVMMIM